jgi:enoyl-CoA hydratase/carnithine racemase
MLLDPKPLSAREAQALGVVAEVVADGQTLPGAKAIAKGWLTRPAVTRSNTRTHFVQPIKGRLVKGVGYGLALEGASAAALVTAMQG